MSRYEFVKGDKRGLLERNVLLLNTEVDGEMVNYVYECLSHLEARGSPDIEIRLFTSGGGVGAGLDVYDALCRYGGKKVGVVYAYAKSMGAIILQACDERVCLEHASVLIHHVSSKSVSLDVLEDPVRLSEMREAMRENQKASYAILMERTGKSEQEIRDACKKDQEMTAEEALAFGLIDRIEPARLKRT